jgi:ribonuclease HII
MRILGIDEAGRGPIMGPLVIAGALVNESDIPRLKALKVRDSKKLTPAQREAMYEELIKFVEHELIVIHAKEIDEAVTKEGYNLNWLEADWIAFITNKFEPDKMIADCPSPNISKFTDYVKSKLKCKPEVLLEHKADQNHLIVSAASILAKVTRDRAVAILRTIYGDFGSGYLTDPKTQEFLKKDHNLPITRKSWVTWKEIEERKHQRTLGDF